MVESWRQVWACWLVKNGVTFSGNSLDTYYKEELGFRREVKTENTNVSLLVLIFNILRMCEV